MTDRPPPQTTMQAVGRVADSVVTGLGGQPLMLAVVVLNIIGIGAALYLLSAIVDTSGKNMQALINQVETAIKFCRPPQQGGGT